MGIDNKNIVVVEEKFIVQSPIGKKDWQSCDGLMNVHSDGYLSPG
jgi:hypothetical protein